MAPNQHGHNHGHGHSHYDTQDYAGDRAAQTHRTMQHMPAEDRVDRTDLQGSITGDQAAQLAPEVRMGDDRALPDTPNWDAFDSEQLYDFATQNNSPTTADNLGRAFNAGGNSLADAANGLFDAVTRLDGAWSGVAADSASDALTPLAKTAGQAGQTAQMMGVQMSRQALAATEVRKLPPAEKFDQKQSLTAMLAGGPAAMQADLKAQKDAAEAVKREQISYLTSYTKAMSAVDAHTPSFVPPPARRINPGAGGDAKISSSPVPYSARIGGAEQGTSTGAPSGGYTGVAPGAGFGEGPDGSDGSGDFALPGSLPGTSSAGFTPGGTAPVSAPSVAAGGAPQLRRRPPARAGSAAGSATSAREPVARLPVPAPDPVLPPAVRARARAVVPDRVAAVPWACPARSRPAAVGPEWVVPAAAAGMRKTTSASVRRSSSRATRTARSATTRCRRPRSSVGTTSSDDQHWHGERLLAPLALDFVWEALDAGEPPYPLEVRSHGVTMDERAALRRRVREDLVADGLIDPAGRLEPELANCSARSPGRPEHRLRFPARAGRTPRARAGGVRPGRCGAGRAGRTGCGCARSRATAWSRRSSACCRRPPRHPSSRSRCPPRSWSAPVPAGGGGTRGERLQETRKALARLTAQPNHRGGQIGVNSRSDMRGRRRSPVLAWFDNETGRYLSQTRAGWVTVAPADTATLRHRIGEMVASP